MGGINLKIRIQFKKQSIYLGLRNCNLGHTDLGRNPNSIPITGGRFRVFMGKKGRLGKLFLRRVHWC